jgi:hypothetical protein
MMLSAAFNNNYVIAFNAKKGTIGYVLDCSLRYIAHARNYENIIHLLYVTLLDILLLLFTEVNLLC